jgi:cytochrome b561
MSLKSTPDRYGSVAVTLHWMSAALIILLIPMGFAMQEAVDDLRVTLYRAHVVLGLAIGLLTLARIVWWAAFDKAPTKDMSAPRFQRVLAVIVHRGLYVAILAAVVSGIGMMVLSGAGQLLFGSGIAPSPGYLMRYPPRIGHEVASKIMIALLVLHVAAALYHHWVRREGTLRRIGFGRGPVTPGAA